MTFHCGHKYCHNGGIALAGYRIPVSWIVILSPFVTTATRAGSRNRSASIPTASPRGPRRRPRYAYFPFGDGPRICIGEGFALLEAQLLLATIAQRVGLATSAGEVAIRPRATLRPRDGLPMTATSLGR